jgi:hypothetical protein
MKPDADMTCPYTGHKDKCMKHFMSCPKWINIMGTNPQTGETINNWKCADAWLPLLLVENSQQQHQTGAAVESFRNEMVKSNQSNLQLMLNQIEARPALPHIVNED